MSTELEFNLSTDKAGRYWLWDNVTQQNAASKCASEKEALFSAVRLYRNAYLQVLAERNDATRKLDAIEEILNTGSEATE